METTMHISLQNIVKRYDKKSIALDASFGFQKGRITGLLGHNGAGKTTAIRIILGLIRSNSGMTLWHARPMKDDDRAHIGYMPETLRMPRNLSCQELLAHQCALYETRKKQKSSTPILERVQVALAQVGLLDQRHKMVHALSKGMGRKLAWAAATIAKPEILILDEPFSGLDPYGRSAMEEWVKDLTRDGTTIVLSTHDLHQAGRLCDDIIVLKHGRVVYTRQDSQNHLQSGAANGYKLSVKGVTEKEIFQTLQALNGHKPEVISTGFAHEIVCASYESAAGLAHNILDKGWILSEMTQIKDQLESDIKKFFIHDDALEAS